MQKIQHIINELGEEMISIDEIITLIEGVEDEIKSVEIGLTEKIGASQDLLLSQTAESIDNINDKIDTVEISFSESITEVKESINNKIKELKQIKIDLKNDIKEVENQSIAREKQNENKNKEERNNFLKDIQKIQKSVDTVSKRIGSLNDKEISHYEELKKDIDALKKKIDDFKPSVVYQGGGGGVFRINELEDVSVVNPTDGQSLVWDSTLNKWVNETVSGGGGGGVTDHGALTGLGDDDHTQYHNDTRGDARYYTKTELNAGQLDSRYYTETEVDGLFTTHTSATDPHTQYQKESEKGTAGGYAELDGTGKVPASQLPSFVDDVTVVANFASLPGTGETGKIYVTEDTNVTYRWNGTGYTEISPSLALGETSSTAYRGDRGKIAYDHSLITSGNPHNVTKTDVGLSNVPNTDTTTTANITDSTNKRFVTDAEKTKLSNTSGVNTGDQTSIIGISGTKAQFNTAVTDGDFMYIGDAPTAHNHTLSNITDVTMSVANLNSLDDGVNSTLHFHDADRARANHTGTQSASTISDFNETAQDAVGTILTDSSTIDFTYNDGANTITADVKANSIPLNDLSDVVITAPTTGQVLKWNGTNWVNDTDSTGGGGSSTLSVTQNAHGFVALDWLRYDEGSSTWVKAQSNTLNGLGMRHVVEVVDANNFKVAKEGTHTISNALAKGEYVLSKTTAGAYTQTIPSSVGDYVLYGMEVINSTTVSFYPSVAKLVGEPFPTDGRNSAGETRTYATANTFTISGDLTGKYQRGDRIKLTQTTVKYFVVLKVAHSAGTTTVTVTGGTDYTLVSASITNNFFSKQASPQGYPDWFTYVPTYVGVVSQPTTNAKFSIIGSTCTVRSNPTSVTSNSTFYEYNAPNGIQSSGTARGSAGDGNNNSVNVDTCYCVIDDASNVIKLYLNKQNGFSSRTASGGKKLDSYISFQFTL